MLPRISVSRRCGAMLANVQRYRMLISDELSEELLQLAHVEAYDEHIVHLLRHPGERGSFGRAGREHVRKNFLLPRLVRDELRLVKQLVG